jgi:hypothetical protein
MEEVLSVPYKGYKIMIFKDSSQYTVRVSKDNVWDTSFHFAVGLDIIPQLPYDEELFEEQIQQSKEYINKITKDVGLKIVKVEFRKRNYNDHNNYIRISSQRALRPDEIIDLDFETF